MTAVPTSAQTPHTLPSEIRVLSIDIGGSGLKALILDASGNPLTDRQRIATPRPATPAAVLEIVWKLLEPLGEFDRVSVGFPGVVVDGVTMTAANLGDEWCGFDLARAITEKLGRPVRVLNDAGVQGYGVIEGEGVEMILTLGTGLGCALYSDGKYVPNLELAHHPIKHGKTYEQYVGRKALDKVGRKKWNKRVKRVIKEIMPVFNPRKLYLGGGNAKKIDVELPANVHITQNVAGLLGGIALWHDSPGTRQGDEQAGRREAATEGSGNR
jgi:polyphosphate glucokinase